MGRLSRFEKQRQKMRQLYVDGMPMDEIAELFELEVRTVYYHRQKDESSSNLDWDQLRMNNKLGDQELDARHRQFLGAMCACFDEEMVRLQEEKNPEKRLDMLGKYTNMYARLMGAARKGQPGVEVASVVVDTLNMVADMALQENPDVARFLLERIDEIQAAVQKRFS